ncbi:hypothetical protein EV175_002542 [Coemansia sp. RSA 1933]|nr:hypothetical protein EV175_002542 [Coemansia sp. RSA 1933]
MVLYNVSQYWRELALGYFGSDATVKPAAEGSSQLEISFLYLPAIFDKFDTKYRRYIRRVTLSFKDLADPIMAVLANMSDSWRDDEVLFPNATELAIDLDRSVIPAKFWADSLTETDKEILKRATDCILKAFPKVGKVSTNMYRPVVNGTQSVSRKVFEENGLESLLISISEGISMPETAIESTAFVGRWPFLANESSLTSLCYSHLDGCENALNSIIRNAPVLVSLSLSTISLLHFKRITLDKDRNPIVYPRLKTLEYFATSYFGLGDVQQIEKGIPFPSLERVNCKTRYIFADDTLFRGCGETLKHLELELSFEAAKMLVDHGVPAKMHSLRCITLANGYQPTYMEDGPSYFMQFALGLVSASARSLSLFSFRGTYEIAENIATCAAAQSLLYLNIPDVKLQLTEVIELINAMPNLEYLFYSCGGLKSSLGRVLYKEMPGLLRDQYYPLSMRFKFCGIDAHKRTPTRSLAVTAMLLAILCPRFSFANVPYNLSDAYNSTIRDAIMSEPYQEYADRLMCLLDG